MTYNYHEDPSLFYLNAIRDLDPDFIITKDYIKSGEYSFYLVGLITTDQLMRAHVHFLARKMKKEGW